MQISSVYINPILNFEGRKQSTVSSLRNMLLKCDVFEKSSKQPFNLFEKPKESWAERHLNTLGCQEEQLEQNGAFTPLKVPFGVEESILKRPDRIQKIKINKIPLGCRELAKETVYLANLTEKMLDEEYGKDNWVFVSIGTSPAGIGKALQIMGHDVRYVPITAFGRMNDASYLSGQKGAGDYKNFLDKIGLNKETISKDKRDYVVCDYTASGDTLDNVQFVARNKLGIDDENVDYVSINNALEHYAIDNYSIRDFNKVEEYIERHMGFETIGEICGVPHLHYKNLENIHTLLMEDKNTPERNFELALAYYIKNGGENED